MPTHLSPGAECAGQGRGPVKAQLVCGPVHCIPEDLTVMAQYGFAYKNVVKTKHKRAGTQSPQTPPPHTSRY